MGGYGPRRAIWEHERANEGAAQILEAECGTRHKTGSRADLCPKCQEHCVKRDTEILQREEALNRADEKA